jgi:2-keto-4-pentenoate hydratase
MTDASSASLAAGILWNAFRNRSALDSLPADCRPACRADGYRVQQALLECSGERGWGWKIAATSTAGQQHIGVDGPLAGRLFASHVHPPGSAVSLSGNRMRVAEVEFAFRIGRSLAPDAAARSRDEILSAVEALLPSIEIPDSRFAPFERAGAPQLIADNACAWRFVAGEPAPDAWRGLDLSTWTVEARVGSRYTRQGIGSNVLGDPRDALVWLVNELSAHGITLEAGQVVTTGTCLPPLAIESGDHVVADFGMLGQVDVRFSR